MRSKLSRPKIFILRAYYPKSIPETALVRYRELSLRLSSLGADVTILTTSFDHSRLKVDPAGEYRDGEVSIRAFQVGSYKNNVSFQRIIFELLFSMRCLAFTIKNKPALVLVGEPAFFLGTAVGLCGLLLKFPVVADFVDLWPEAYEATRPPSNILKIVFGFLKFSRDFRRKFLFSQSFFCSETYKKCIVPTADVGDQSRPTVFYWSSRLPTPKDISSLNSEIGIVYFGSLGEGYDIEGFVKAAGTIGAEFPNTRFYIAGDGPKRNICIEADRRGDITFLGYIDGPETIGLLTRCSIGVLPYRGGSAVAMPIKLFDYLRCGLFVVSSIQLEAKEVLENHNCGISYVSDSDGTAITQALRRAVNVVLPSNGDSVSWRARSMSLTAMFDVDEQYGRFAREVYRFVE